MLIDVHKGVIFPGSEEDVENLVLGSYEYYHYTCDGSNDTVIF
jgi:hypothetical protein